MTILADEEAHRTGFRGFEKEYQNAWDHRSGWRIVDIVFEPSEQ